MNAVKSELLTPGCESSQYFCGLNDCFGNWGSLIDYDWTFNRRFDGTLTDRLGWRGERGELVAGSGVSYRWIISPSGCKFKVGVMTGSWTMPEYRGRGIFKDAISQSLDLSLSCGCDGLIAYVTHDNPSAKALVAAGSGLVKTSYVFTDRQDSEAGDIEQFGEFEKLSFEELLKTAKSRADGNLGSIRYFYGSDSDCAGQLLLRPNPVAGYRIADTSVVVEFAPNDVRLLCCSGNRDFEVVLAELKRVANHMGRRTFAYLSNATVPDGFQSKAGYITVLSRPGSELHSLVPPGQVSSVNWLVDSGDRM